MEELTPEEKDFVITALNAYWNNSHDALTDGKHNGDRQQENLKWNMEQSKKLMRKLGVDI